MIELLWNNPISETKMAKYVDALALRRGQRVLDVGCGCGELLIRLCESIQIEATGIDSSPEHIAEPQRRARRTGKVTAIRFVAGDARSFSVAPDSLDVAICIGSSHACGLGTDVYRSAIEQMIPMVRPGGRILIAEGYMKQPAAPEYRRLLGDSMPDEMTHAANVATGKDLGLNRLAAWTSSEDEWDEFEWAYQRVVERRADEQPNHGDVIAKRTQRRQWMDAYLRWGRDTLGFGIYLFQRPGL